MELSSKLRSFKVRRQKPVLVLPASQTPVEIKPLSDIDDQQTLRVRTPFVLFYKRSGKEDDPAKVIKEALAKALVFYYPLAGRLREWPGKKLVVECTGEGVLFIEADAEVTMEELEEGEIRSPIQYLDELIFNVPGCDTILHSPLLLVQVTRLRCGSFIVGVRLSHPMADSAGFLQFMTAVAELARGASVPSVVPVWMRELLSSTRDPPRITCIHHEFDVVSHIEKSLIHYEDMIHKSFFFGSGEISALRASLSPHLSRKCSTAEVLSACIWRSRVSALKLDREEEVRFINAVSVHSLSSPPPLPEGYYGNAFAFPAALTTAGELIKNPLDYAVELVMKTKTKVTMEYMKSMADLMVLRGRPHITSVRSFVVVNVTRVRFDKVDFGWGGPISGGLATGGFEHIPGLASCFLSGKNKIGENGIVVPICLPKYAMEEFVREMKMLLRTTKIDDYGVKKSKL